MVPDVHFLCNHGHLARTLSYHWTVNVALCGEKSTSVLSQVWANNLAFLQSALDTGVLPIRGASRRCRIFCGGDSPWLRRLSGVTTHRMAGSLFTYMTWCKSSAMWLQQDVDRTTERDEQLLGLIAPGAKCRPMDIFGVIQRSGGLEVDWADAFAVPETESVTVPRPKKKRTEEPAATSHLPPAISASHTAKPPHPPGKVLAQKTADQQLMAQAAHRVQRQTEQAKKKEDEAKKKKKEEDEKRKKKEKDEEEKRKKKEREKKEKEEEEKRRKKAEEEKAEKVMQRALSSSLHVLCISSRVLCSVLRVLCLCYASALLFPGQQDGTAAGTSAAARIKASTEAACPNPRPASRTRRSVRFHPTQYGSQCQAAEQSRRGQGGKR